MEQPVEDRGGDGVVAEHFGPLGHGFVGGEDHARSFVSARDHLEEIIRLGSGEREIAHFVEDEELGFGGVGAELPVEPSHFNEE